MGDRKAVRILLTAVVWLIIAGVLASAYKFIIRPKKDRTLTSETGSSSQYKDELTVAMDSFSGYCLFRSPELQERMRRDRTKLNIVDDGADYGARLEALERGRVDLAVFTVDSLIAAGAAAGSFPGSIVMVIDETQGADAMVAWKSALPSFQDLNRPDARVVLTPNSPSEFLARTGIAHFSLPDLPADWMQPADGAGEVFKQFKAAARDEPRAYVLWEPFVSRARELPDVAVLLDSSKLNGYIVDVLVARRDLLKKKPEKVRKLIEAYLRTAYEFADAGKMEKRLIADAAETGTKGVKAEQAKQMIQGIEWKNTLENYAHFGLVGGRTVGELPHLEDIIARITDVLVRTGAVDEDPLKGNYASLFYDRIMRELQADNFHPGRELNVIAGAGVDIAQIEKASSHQVLPALSDSQWEALVQVGELNLPSISFGRGGARLHIGSQRTLDDLATRLKTLPEYYVQVVGNTRSEGDPEANRRLAEGRSKAAIEYLLKQGINANRLRSVAAPASRSGGGAQAVSFVVGQRAY